jgi:hypothetical protein
MWPPFERLGWEDAVVVRKTAWRRHGLMRAVFSRTEGIRRSLPLALDVWLGFSVTLS